MEKHFLDEFVQEFEARSSEEFNGKVGVPWYNPYGDCIMYQTIDVAVVGDRIDEYLTIFRSAEDDKPVGFQIKDVMALLRKHRYDLFEVTATVQGEEVVQVSITALLLAAYEDNVASIRRRRGYVSAMQAKPQDDEVSVPIAV